MQLSTIIIIASFLVCVGGESIAQTISDEAKLTRLAPKELAIPTSPLFDLMGVAPSQVAHTADIKNFKVDWSFKNWRVNPNLAIQSQPVWEMFYNRKNLEKYQKASKFQRTLASLDLSLGTIQTELSDRRVGGALKMNIYKQKDPLLYKGVYDNIQKSYADELIQLKENEKKILHQLDSLTKPDDLKKKKEELRINDELMTSFYSRRNTAIQSQAAQYINDNWNSAYVDVAFGKIYTYTSDSAGSLSKLKLNRNTGSGAWINFGFGVGKRGLVSGLIRSSFYEEEVTFDIKDDISGLDSTASTIAANRLISLGINFRYGGPIHNFFIEFIYEGKTLKTPIKAVNESFTVPNGKTIITSTLKWDIVHPYTFNMGGDWRISRNVVLNYGLRCVLDKNFKTVSFIPIANIACMMR